jgi:hypothetical protein
LAKWTPISEVAVFDYNGEMLTLGSTDPGARGHFLFTPNHRWPVVWNRMDGSGVNRDIVRGYELRTTHKIPRTAEFVDWPEESLLDARDAAIFGWLITDGTFRKDDSAWCIYQSPKKFADEIERLLGDEACKRQTHPDSGVHMWPLKVELRNRFKAKGIFGRKDARWVVTRLNKEAAAAMWGAMYKADGMTAEPRRQDFFAAQNQDTFDAAQILVQLHGYHMNQTPRGGCVSQKCRSMKVAGAMGCTWYSGKVWCPQTGTGTWLMRRNGKVIFTGNTFMRKNLPLMIENILLDPRKMRLYGLATGEVGSRRRDRDQLPEWLRDRGPFDFGIDADGQRVFRTFGLPPEDLFSFGTQGQGIQRSFQRLGSLLAPAARIPMELAAKRDLSTGREIPTTAPETILRLSPASRFGTSGRALFEGLTGRRSLGESLLAQGAGIGTRRLNPKVESLNLDRRRIERALQGRFDQGVVGKFQGFHGGDEGDARLRSQLARVMAKLREARQQSAAKK